MAVKLGVCEQLAEVFRDLQLEVNIDLLIEEIVVEFFHVVDFVILVLDLLESGFEFFP